MESINRIRASDGTANASVATVQSTRAALASTIIVDTVDGIPTEFMGSMGTPHTFTDPITSESITVISEATAVDFAGHVDGANLEIDTIAPGYTDAGSAIGDIVIIRPTTQYADNVADVLAVSHNDDGTLKDDSVTTGVIADASVTPSKLSTDATQSVVAASQTTTSTSFTDLSTVGPSVTVTIGANGLALVGIAFTGWNSTAEIRSEMAFAISGATTVAAGSSSESVTIRETATASGGTVGKTTLVSGLNPGSTTFTAKYRVQANTGTFVDRSLWVLPL